MGEYLVSARKYRPTTFEAVVGQRALTTTLRNAILSNKLAHAYLFCGPRGVGKTSCARIFAKTINCQNLTPSGDACNECESCRSFNEQRSLNIHELDAASNNMVDDIRSLIEQVRIPPQIGKYKVYIIDEVHMLSLQAFNAFLKTLEEPPHHAIFILATTEKHKILPTILSRCQIFDFVRITVQDIVEHLEHVAQQENIEVETEALNVIARKADGGMRDALSVFDQVAGYGGGKITYQSVLANLNVLDYDYYFKFTDAIINQEVGTTLLILNELLGKGFEGNDIISGLSSHFRDLLVTKLPGTGELLEVGASIRIRYEEYVKKCSPEFLYNALKLAGECELNYRQSRNKRLLVELTLIKLCQINGRGIDIGQASPPLKDVNPSTTQTTNNATTQTQKQPSTPQTTEERQSSPLKPNITPNAQQSQPEKAKEELKEYSKTGSTQKLQEPQSKPQKETSKRLSLRDTISKVKEEEKKLEEKPQNLNSKKSPPLSGESLTNAWIRFADNLKEEVLLKRTMTAHLPQILNQDTFKCEVQHPGQLSVLEDASKDIIPFLREELKNDKIKMSIEVKELERSENLYTDKERYQYLASKYPILEDLRKEFNLQLD